MRWFRGHWLLLVDLSIGCLALATPAATQSRQISDADLPALLTHMQENMAENAKISQQYTSIEVRRTRNSFVNGGNFGEDISTKFENMFVEGIPYKRKVEVNGRPLSLEEAAEEQKRLDIAVTERRAMPAEQKRRYFRAGYHSSLPVCCLATMFDNRVIGHDQIDGREMLVIESHPKAGAKPPSRQERSTLDWKETTWIDRVDLMPARVEAELLTDREQFEKGMTARIDYVRLQETGVGAGIEAKAVWLQSRSISTFRFRARWNDGSGTTEETWSNYKRFKVDIRLLDDSMQEIPPTSEP
jgi:hypothetical protein